MVIEGVITNDTSHIWVKVSKTDPDYGAIPLAVSGANVKVWSSDGDTVKLVEVSQGYYESINTIAKTGNTYYLFVQYQGVVYNASSFMAPVPTLDSLTLKYTGTDRVRLYFKDPPNEENYYMIRSVDPGGAWGIIFISDKFLNPNIDSKGLVLVASRRVDIKNGLDPFEADHWKRLIISMSSISKLDYNYYQSLEMQFSTNGGAYSPSPANPIGNISNGAMGLFRASSISYITHYPDSI